MKKLLDENPDADCVLRGKDFEAKDVFDAARSGDALAAREVDEMTDTLGMALASIASTTDPEMFLIGGAWSRASSCSGRAWRNPPRANALRRRIGQPQRGMEADAGEGSPLRHASSPLGQLRANARDHRHRDGSPLRRSSR